MSARTRDWERLGKAMRLQRQRLGLKQTEVAEAAGVTTRTVIHYEGGRAPKAGEEVPGGYYRIEPIIGWGPGSVDEVLAGGDPFPLSPAGASAAPNLTGLTAEALALYPSVVSFGQLCVAAGGNAGHRAAFDEAATRLLESVPAYAALGAKGLQRADLGLAAMRPHAEGEPTPLDDVLRALQAADEAEANGDGSRSPFG